MICSVCHEDKTVTLDHEQRIDRRGVVRWRICAGCELEERRLGDDRALAAIEQAERAGV